LPNAILDLYPNRGLAFVRGEGSFLVTRDGTRYLDLMTNYGAALFGHGHPVILGALRDQLDRLATLHGSFISEVRSRATMALLDRVPVPGGSAAWGNTGAESVEAALKFAAAATGRSRVIAFQGGYHGKTLGALAVTDGARYRGSLGGLVARHPFVPYGGLGAVSAAIGTETAAVIVEPIQGESGVRVPPEEFLPALRRICTDRGILLIVDEIQTGGGRTGSFTECARLGVEPDILCLGKGLAGGFPVGVTIVSPAVAERLPRGLHTSTFAGNPTAAAGVLAALSLVTADCLARVTELGDRARALLVDSGVDPTSVRGRGLMIGIEIAGGGRAGVLKALQRERILAIPAGEDVVRLLPPITIESGDLEDGLRVLARVLADGAARR
jgi:acetylornithine/succinyldiaminopimelate/putrescine aminotransferase